MLSADRHKHQVYGDVVREQIGPMTFVMSFRAEDMKTLTIHEGEYPFRTTFLSLKAYRESRKQWYSNTGLLILQGKEWRHLRSKIQPHLMKPKSIQAYLDPIQDVAKEFSSRIRHIKNKNSEVIDFLNELNKCVLEVVAAVALNTRLGCLKIEPHQDSDEMKLINAVKTIFRTMNKLEGITGNVQLWRYFSTPTWRKFVRASDVYSEIAYKFIQRSLDNIISNTEEKELTLLQSMLSTQGLDISGIMVTVTDMFIAGFESVSHTTGFLLYNLAKNPDKQEKLYQELKRVLPSKSDRITPDTLNELKYLKLCLKETYRTHPTARGISRTLDHDVVISGYRVPAGTIIFILNHVLCKSEKYFKNPNEFIPERWDDKENKPDPLAHQLFGFGPRSCVGKRFAELEMICIVAQIIRNYQLEYHHEDIGMRSQIINHPDRPLQLKFIDR